MKGAPKEPKESRVEVRLPKVGLPRKWTKATECEFRRLALEEAKGTLTAAEAQRLEDLSVMRDRLDHPRTADEILTQLRRERLLDKMAAALKEYLNFIEAESQKRHATR